MKTQPLKGMRDLLPREQALRDYIQGQILDTYRAAGFQRISTPILEDMENLDKSDGGDNLNLIFKVLKRGEKLAAALRSGDEKQLSDMGLRYDLTLPLSRYYAANRNELPNPFKVIQTDRVYRAERPQKGRLREFVQCDIDILGDSSPNAEVELIDVTTRALLRIGFKDFTVNINDRRILRAMLEKMGFAADQLDSVCISFDKLDKIGADGVKKELLEKEFDAAAVEALDEFLRAGDFSLDAVTARVGDETLTADLRYVIATAEKIANGRYGIAYAPSLVRGQGYYTGMVFEVTCPQFSGAVAGGGRYDNMVGKFIGQQVPAVGFSIGFERVCGILLEQDYQIPGAKQKLALLYLKDADFAAVLAKADALRAAYDVTVLPQAKKLGKQFGTVIVLYLVSTFLAAVIAVIASYLFPVTITLTEAVSYSAPESFAEIFTGLLNNIVSNPIGSIVSANYLGVLFWAIVLGFAFKGASDTTKKFLADASEAVTKAVRFVINLAPFGILGLVFSAVSTSGLAIFTEYGKLLLILVGCMLFAALVVNPIMTFIIIRKNPYPLVFKCLKESGVTAFFTRSSAANIPVNMSLCESLGLDKEFYSVSIPLGATINMAGAAVTITVMTLAAVHTLGITVQLPVAIILSVMAALGACGASGVAGGSLLLIPMACSLFGISNDIAMQVVGVGFIIGVIQDSVETAINSSSDALFTAVAEFKQWRKAGKEIKF
mgnify:CR=1 FL=1